MTASGYPSLVVRSSGTSPAVLPASVTAEVQQSLFDVCGVLAPVLRLEIDQHLTGDKAELWLDGQLLDTVNPYDPAADLVAALRRHADQLVTPKLVEHYIRKLQSHFPTLVAIVRERIAMETLIGELQNRLRNNGTIRDLPGILEDLLARDLG